VETCSLEAHARDGAISAWTAGSGERVTSNKTKEDSKRPRGFADALVWIVVLIILTPLVIFAVLALYQRFF
jgi:hypothetical protein